MLQWQEYLFYSTVSIYFIVLKFLPYIGHVSIGLNFTARAAPKWEPSARFNQICFIQVPHNFPTRGTRAFAPRRGQGWVAVFYKIIKFILLCIVGYFFACGLFTRPRRMRKAHCVAGGKERQVTGVSFKKISKAGGRLPLGAASRGLYLWCYKSWYYKFPRGTRAFAPRRPRISIPILFLYLFYLFYYSPTRGTERHAHAPRAGKRGKSPVLVLKR